MTELVEKMDVEKKVELLPEEKTSLPVELKSLPTETDPSYKGFMVPPNLDRIKPLFTPATDAVVDTKLDEFAFATRGVDVSRDANVQELGFLSILNMLPDEKARNEFLRWAKAESLKQARGEKISQKMTQVRQDSKSVSSGTISKDVGSLPRRRVPAKQVPHVPQYKRVPRRPHS